MKKFCCSLIILLFSLLLPLLALGSPAQRKLTLMIYMCGSNLESSYGSATADYLEMTQAGVESDISVLVMMGGTVSWQMSLNAQETVIMEIGHRGARQIWSEGKRNMGDGETLSALLQFGKEQRPAEEYALILWDHGGGPVGGLCWDEQFGADHLTIAEMTGALKSAGFDREKLQWIGFDACLMGSAEVGSSLVPYAEYMISSQAEEPASGWDYSFLQGLSRDAGAEETGRRVIDAYFSAASETAGDLTLACIDLSALEPVTDQMNSLFSDLADQLTPDSFSDISRLRIAATGFGRAGEDVPEESGYDLVDLVSLTESYASRSPEKAEALVRAVRQAVVFQRSNVPDTCGLSVYHPYRNRSAFREKWQDAYAALSFCPGYTRYADAYGRIMIGESLVLWNNLLCLKTEKTASGSGHFLVQAELSQEQADNLASARLIILARNIYDMADDAYYQLYSSADVRLDGTVLSGTYDGSCLEAFSESGMDEMTGALSYRITEDGTYIIRLYPFKLDGERSSTPLLAEYNMDDSGRLRFKDFLAYDEMTATYSSRIKIDLSEYDGFTFINEYRLPTSNDQGEILSFDRWEEDGHPDVQMRARYDVADVSFQPVFSNDLSRAEELYAAFEITDTQGRRYMTGQIPLDENALTEYPLNLSVDASRSNLQDIPPQISCTAYLRPADSPDRSRIILNIAFTNPLDQEMTFQVRDVRLNGMETGLAADSSQGTGSVDFRGRRTLASGETGTASLTVKYADVLPLLPESVSLQEVSLMMVLGVLTEGTDQYRTVTLAFSMNMEIPLHPFCGNTDVLPPESLAVVGRENHAFGSESDVVLFSGNGCRISLRGLFAVEKSLVLRLCYTNETGSDLHLALGQAKLDGKEAVLGKTRSVYVQARNNLVRTGRLSLPDWEAPAGVKQDLAPGAFLEEYVELKPSDPQTGSVRAISFHAYCWYQDETDSARYTTLFTDAVIGFTEPVLLRPQMAFVAFTEDYRITQGTPLPLEDPLVLSREPFPVPSVPEPVELRLPAEPGQEIQGGFYYLLRRVRSNADLTDMHILNTSSAETNTLAIPFRDDQEWLIYEAVGDLVPDADGASAFAVFSGLLPAVHSGGNSILLTPDYIVSDTDGSNLHVEVANHLSLISTVFPDINLFSRIGAFNIRFDRRTGQGILENYQQEMITYPSLAGILRQNAYLLPADADEDTLFEMLNDLTEKSSRLHQYLLLSEDGFSFSLDPVTDPENYAVVFMYWNGEGDVHCTLPQPLTNFLPE